MVRIVLDGFPLAVRSAGIGTYTRELAGEMAAVAPRTSFTLFQPPWPRAGDHGSSAPPNLGTTRSWRYPFIMGQPAPIAPAVLSLESALDSVDLFHGTNYALPARCRAPRVATVHDLALLRHPELGNTQLRAMVRRATRALSHADKVIAVSQATKDDLVELCGVDPDRIVVIHNGCSDTFAPMEREHARAAVERELGIAVPYVLHVGTLEPRKNLGRLIEAYALVAGERTIPHHLILAGEPGWEPARLDQLAERQGVADRVHFTGRVSGDLLRPLYAAADVFVYPSLYEGFGLPVIEAMACGTPVVTSNRSALPEVAGNASLIVDPSSVSEIATAIRRCLSETGLAQALRANGLARASALTWAAAARATLRTYGELLGREVC